jgi:serine/threonine protein phosphatase PrpC
VADRFCLFVCFFSAFVLLLRCLCVQVFDGHGALGHEVSSFLIQELPKHFCLKFGTEVLRPDGSHSRVEELQEGMEVVGPRGETVRVAKAAPGQADTMYRVQYADDEAAGHTVTADHKLVLRWERNPSVSANDDDGEETTVSFLDAQSLEWTERKIDCGAASSTSRQKTAAALSWLEEQAQNGSVRAMREGDLFEVAASRYDKLSAFVKANSALPLVGTLQQEQAIPATFPDASLDKDDLMVYQMSQASTALPHLQRAWTSLDASLPSKLNVALSELDESAPMTAAELEAALAPLHHGGVLVAFGDQCRAAWMQHWRSLCVSGEMLVDDESDITLHLQLANEKTVFVRFAPHPTAGWQWNILLRVLGKAHKIDASSLSAALKSAPSVSRRVGSVQATSGGRFMQVEVASADELFVLADGVITHNSKQPNLDSAPVDAITKAFIDCNVKLAASSIDCTFSGSTGIVVYLANGKIYSCNCGDSRAVLARATTNNASGETKLTAVALSSDQKPEREDEKARILAAKGRVEACKGAKGEDIGPPRVWLSHQDVPGLAMSRSFGDLIAASVGVIAKPEVWEREQSDADRFMILASDGVWEFIENQAAVDIVASHWPDLEGAAKALTDEATRRWHAEEEVVDDITAVIVAFDNNTRG